MLNADTFGAASVKSLNRTLVSGIHIPSLNPVPVVNVGELFVGPGAKKQSRSKMSSETQ